MHQSSHPALRAAQNATLCIFPAHVTTLRIISALQTQVLSVAIGDRLYIISGTPCNSLLSITLLVFPCILAPMFVTSGADVKVTSGAINLIDHDTIIPQM